MKGTIESKRYSAAAGGGPGFFSADRGDIHRRWFGGLDPLRALAALLVFVYHSWFLFHRPDCGLVPCQPSTGFVARQWEHLVVNFGALGVALFYVLSGFLLYRPFVAARAAGVASPDGRRYAIRRAARVVPAYWVAMLVVGFGVGGFAHRSAGDVLAYLSFLEVYSKRLLWTDPDLPTWTVCVEVSFYIFLPIWAALLGALTSRFGGGGIRRMLALELGCLGALAVFSVVWKVWVIESGLAASDFEPLLVALPASLDVFAAGMALAVVSARSDTDGRLPGLFRFGGRYPWVCIAFALLVLELTGWLVAFDGPLQADWRERAALLGVLKIPVAVLLLLPAVGGPSDVAAGRRLPWRRPLVWIGVVSYGLYLWHVPILNWMSGLVGLAGPASFGLFVVVAACGLVLSLAVAALSWRLLESPVLNWAKRLGGSGQ